VEGNMAKRKKVVLAYSGGLDTSVILRWLIETYDADVVAVSVDLGQDEDQEAIRKKAKITLSLGEIHDVAEVYMNGVSAGILWKKPYKIDVTRLVSPGENELKIEVVNLWVNRLTGDMLSRPENRYCRTNQPYITRDDMGFDNWAEGGDETFRLKTSGLLGPVNLVYAHE